MFALISTSRYIFSLAPLLSSPLLFSLFLAPVSLPSSRLPVRSFDLFRPLPECRYTYDAHGKLCALSVFEKWEGRAGGEEEEEEEEEEEKRRR